MNSASLRVSLTLRLVGALILLLMLDAYDIAEGRKE